MNVIYNITKRNLVRTFRNKATVMIVLMMSLLPGVLLFIMGEIWMVPIFTDIVGDSDVAWSLLRANIIAITLSLAVFTAPVSILSLVTEDYDKKIMHNFLIAPIKRAHISISYILSAVLFGLSIIGALLVFGQIILFLTGDGFLGFSVLLKLIGLSLLVLASISTIFSSMVSRRFSCSIFFR